MFYKKVFLLESMSVRKNVLVLLLDQKKGCHRRLSGTGARRAARCESNMEESEHRSISLRC